MRINFEQDTKETRINDLNARFAVWSEIKEAKEAALKETKKNEKLKRKYNNENWCKCAALFDAFRI